MGLPCFFARACAWKRLKWRKDHREGSRFYGTTRKGKYMIEQDAMQAGYKPAPRGQ